MSFGSSCRYVTSISRISFTLRKDIASFRAWSRRFSVSMRARASSSGWGTMPGSCGSLGPGPTTFRVFGAGGAASGAGGKGGDGAAGATVCRDTSCRCSTTFPRTAVAARSSFGTKSSQRPSPTKEARARATASDQRVRFRATEPRSLDRDGPGHCLVGMTHRARAPVLAVEGLAGDLPDEVLAGVVVGSRRHHVRAGHEIRAGDGVAWAAIHCNDLAVHRPVDVDDLRIDDVDRERRRVRHGTLRGLHRVVRSHHDAPDVHDDLL